MKQFSITLQKDAVEKHICKLIDDLSKSKLSGEDEMIFNLLQLGEVIPLNAVETKDKPFLVQLIEAKIETFFDYSIQDSRIIGIIAQMGGLILVKDFQTAKYQILKSIMQQVD